MDFSELEALEGLRWSWNSWPVSKSAAEDLVVPLSVMFTPLMQPDALPLLTYDPLFCPTCNAVLNPYARVDYPSRIWTCPFCYLKNPFPKSYSVINEDNIPAELFPTYNTVEYKLGKKGSSMPQNSLGNVVGVSTSTSIPRMGSFSSSSLTLPAPGLDKTGMGFGPGPAFVFVVDACIVEDELRVLKNELLHVIARLPEYALVGLIVFDSMVRVYDLAFTHSLRVVLFPGDRNPSPEQTKKLLRIFPVKHHLGKTSTVPRQGFLIPVGEYEFNITTAIEDLRSSTHVNPGHRPLRSTGAAISVAIGLLEACSVNMGSRIMVFTSGPATIGPGMIVNTDFSNAMRTHRDLNSGSSAHFRSFEFYKTISQRLVNSSVILDLFACSLDQVGAAELRVPVESSGGFMMLGEFFDWHQFRRCLHHLFILDDGGNLKFCFDATIEIITTKDVKICGALGPCISLQKKNSSVSNNEIGQGGTYMWKLGTLTDKTCIAFFFAVCDKQKVQPNSVFFIQFITRYRYGNMEMRKRVTTAARRWVGNQSPDIAAGFDQEAAAAVMARLAIDKAESRFAPDVNSWLDKKLIQFASRHGDYIPEDPTSFRLLSSFSLYPQFMYYLRRSQFINVSSYTPDETAFFRLMLNREGVVNSLLMVQPSLLQYSLDGPPIPVPLDVRSISPKVILLLDSYFNVLIHYGSDIAQWRKVVNDKDPNSEKFRKLLEASYPNSENFQKLLEAPEYDAEELLSERIPVPKFTKCDQHSSQARILLAVLNPSVTQESTHTSGSEIIFTDDISLQVFIELVHSLAVQG